MEFYLNLFYIVWIIVFVLDVKIVEDFVSVLYVLFFEWEIYIVSSLKMGIRDSKGLFVGI